MKIQKNTRATLTEMVQSLQKKVSPTLEKIKTILRRTQLSHTLSALNQHLKQWAFKKQNQRNSTEDIPLETFKISKKSPKPQQPPDLNSFMPRLNQIKQDFFHPSCSIEEKMILKASFATLLDEIEDVFKELPRLPDKYDDVLISLQETEEKMTKEIDALKQNALKKIRIETEPVIVPDKMEDDPKFLDDLRNKTTFLDESTQSQLFAHIEGSGLWKEEVLKAVNQLNDQPADYEISEILKQLLIPHTGDLAKAIFKALN